MVFLSKTKIDEGCCEKKKRLGFERREDIATKGKSGWNYDDVEGRIKHWNGGWLQMVD